MEYSELIDKDITVYTEFGPSFRGILKAVDGRNGVLTFEVGIDILYVRADGLHAVTVHGTS